MIPSPVWKTEQNLTTYKGYTTLKQATCVGTGTFFSQSGKQNKTLQLTKAIPQAISIFIPH
jgi:hypothetical protein